jgi:uncharacterized protein (DUF58 family)
MSTDTSSSDALLKLPGGKVVPLLKKTNTALNHDFCPWANRWVYWLKNPFWCLVLALSLSLACGIFLSPAALFVSAILMLIVAIGVSLPWLAVRGIDVHLAFDIRRSRVGQPVLIRLKVRNRWPWPVWGLSVVRGFALRTVMDTDEGVSLARVPGWSTVEYSWQFIPQVRGRYPLTVAEVETAFPFGLYRASRAARVDGHVIVWPKTVSLSGLPDAADERHSEDQLADRRAGEFGDMLGTRPFRQGDSLRRVHWAQTARQQQLIVCERQAPATSVVRVTLDLSSASHPQCDPQQRRRTDSVELAVQVAASVCESLHRQHSRVELMLGDDLYVAGEGAAGFHRLLDALAQAGLSHPAGMLNRANASSGFGIFITTPVGYRLRGQGAPRQHVITVSDGSAMQQAVSPSAMSGISQSAVRSVGGTDAKEGVPGKAVGVWIELKQPEEVETLLPRRWKGACNAR